MCLVVVENVLVGPRIYSARESNMTIVEELRMEVPGPENLCDISLQGALLGPFVMAAG